MVDDGTLTLGAGVTLAAGSALIVNGGTFVPGDQNETFGDLSGAGGTIALGTGTLTFGAGDTTEFDGTITGAGELVEQGGGQITFGGALGLSGNIAIDASTMVFTGDTSQIAGNIIDDGELVFSQAGNTSFTGAISGSGDVVMDGTGTLTLSGDETFTGGITIESGTLNLTGGTSDIAGGITVDGGVLELNGVATELGTDITDDGSVVVQETGDTSYGGAISGTGDLTEFGAGTLTLSGSLTYTGTTDISGNLALAGETVNTDSTSGFNDNGNLVFTLPASTTLPYGWNIGPDTVYFDTPIYGGGGITLNGGAGSVLFMADSGGTFTYGGGTTVDSGALLVPTSTSAGSGPISIGSFAPGATPATFGVTAPGVPTNAFYFANPYATLHLATSLVPETVTVGPDDQLDLQQVGGGAVTISLDADYVGYQFNVAADPQYGTDISLAATQFNVDSAAQLTLALEDVSVGGIDYAPNTQYQIDIGANISGLTADLPAINLGSDDTLEIFGDNYTLDAGGMDRGLFVLAGSVQIFSLTIENAVATGGAGGAGVAGGGGGAGLGGGLFVGQGANVVFNR